MKRVLLLIIFIFSHNTSMASELWEDNKQYETGDIISWEDMTYIATSRSFNYKPEDNTDNLDGWVTFDTSKIELWEPSETYSKGVLVKHKSNFYLSKWWNENEEPSFGASNSNGPWFELGISSELTNKERIDQLAESNLIPNLTDRSDELLGIDIDGNGIRDDVDNFIEINYQEESHKKAAQQLAKGLQKSLVVDTGNIIKVKEINRINSRAINCIFFTFNDSGKNAVHPTRVASELESVTTSTKKRLLAYLEFNKALDGTTWSIPVGNTCE